MKTKLITSALFFLCGILSIQTYATGEASTYFEIFVPPNNDAARRDVCLIITAIYDNTSFTITDDDMDGDNDDSVSGTLMAGQSYILYIRENGINDDAPHPGESSTKHDGDFFIISSDKLILASQSTKSDWQHDWVPATNKSSLGQKFIIYSPPTSFSNRDLNVFAYQDNTEVTIRKISWANQTSSGYTNVDMASTDIVMQRTLNIGEDIIFFYQDGRDIMETGATYLVESNKAVSVQYGALWSNARDGGGYVPSSNGSSAGELFYFTVPYQSSREQEIRIVSWDANNAVDLEKYVNGSWQNIQSWSLAELEAGDWVSYSGNLTTVFRVSCSSGKKVSVFEANWLETGSPGTSDIASMVSSEDGTTAGNRFLVYMAPPGKEQNVTNPFTGLKFSYGSHVYLFARQSANVTVKDANTNGSVISRSYTIQAGRYIDCYLDQAEWKSIYNGDGNPNSGSDRPYLLIQSDSPISVFNTNFNDNWMAYFGTSQTQDFSVTDSTSTENSLPGDTVTITASINLSGSDLTNPDLTIYVSDGASVSSADFNDLTNQTSYSGESDFNTNTQQTEIVFSGIPDLDEQNSYETETQLIMNLNYQNGEPIPDRTVISVETVVGGDINGVYQQSSSASGILNETSDQSNLIFQQLENTATVLNASENSWSVSFADFDNNGFDDIFVPNYNKASASELYKNLADGTFSRIISGSIVTNTAGSVSSSWADYDNDGYIDLFVANNFDAKNFLYRNIGNNSFSKVTNDPIVNDKGYSHSTAWADYNNDGFVDLLVSEYFSTKFNCLYKNNGDGSFTKVNSGGIVNENTSSLGVSWADFDNDGDHDVLIANYENMANSLWVNGGNGSFTKYDQGSLATDQANSTGASWADYDNDGDLDLYVTNASLQNNNFYKNNGDGTFTSITTGDFVNDGGDSHGSVWGDLDNDGDLDLFVSNDRGGLKFLYINNGDGTFGTNTSEAVCSRAGNSFGSALSDIDRDGDLDLFVANHSDENNFLFLNNGNSNAWFELRLTGTNSNKSAIGARIKVKATIDGQAVWQIREVSSQSGGFGAQSSLVAHFGLGDANSIDSVIINWPSGYIQYLTNQTINQYLELTEDNGSVIQGYIFNDKNNNCVKDEGEEAMPDVIIKVLPGPRYTSTNQDGLYSISLEPGSYTISQTAPQNWEQICPASDGSHQLTVNSIGETLTDYDFSNQGITYKPDLWVDIGGTALRRGFNNSLNISYANHGSVDATDVNISLVVGSDAILNNSSPSWDIKNGNTYSWDVGGLGINETKNIQIVDSVDLYSNLGDSIYFNLSISSTLADSDESNNSTQYGDMIVGSVDPNDLLVNPEGAISKNTTLQYKIRFENMGNYPADFIIIKDTLSELLDINSLQIGASSHMGSHTIKDRVIIWEFYNVDLPPKSEDEEKSQGFVQFSIKPNPEIQEGSSIKNKAFIRFDYNDFIKTNTTVNRITHPYSFGPVDKAEVIIFPNPIIDEGVIRIKNTVNAYDPIIISEIKLFDLTGKIVKHYSGINHYEYILKSSRDLRGFYLLELTDDNKQSYAKKVVFK